MKRIVYALIIMCSVVTVPLKLSAQPTANFTSDKVAGCSPIVVQFTDLSTGSPTSWLWDLGNGATSTLQNPSTTYITPGSYTVKLTVSNSGGNHQKMMTGYITVYPSPIVNFTGDSLAACPPKTITFNNLTSLGTAGGTYLWDFGDGYTSSSTNPSHTYTTVGNYAVTLIATNTFNCTKSLTKPGYIQLVQKPIANFTSATINGCAPPYNAIFTNTSANAVSYNWDFGDGGTSTNANPTHTYTTTGSFNVRLIATNSSGCKDTFLRTSYVNVGILNSQFSASQTSVCAGTTVSFTNTTTPPGSSSAWRFDGVATSGQTSPSFTYNTAGSYTARLISTLNGCSDTATQNITVLPKPTAQFSSNDTIGCSVPFTSNFTNSSSGATSYAWAFGNGATSTNTNPSYTYTSLGNYSVKLVATAANGCKDSITKIAYIRLQQPTATITANPNGGCSPLNVSLTANISSLLPVTNYSWNFGDGSSVVSCGSCPNQTHVYTGTGSYTVTLTYTTGPGCINTVQRVITVSTKPNASFNINPSTVCPNLPVTTTNTSTGATNYMWYSGNGNTSTLTQPTFTYKSGTYTIMLVAFNNGCPDTFTRNVTVQLPRAAFTRSYPCNNRLNVTFTDLSAGANTYYWDFGDGNTSTTAGNVTHLYSAYGIYNVKLGVRNNSTNCTDTAYLTINLMPLISDFAAIDTTLCQYNIATFNSLSPYTYFNYSWSLGNGSANTITGSHNHPYNTPGIYTVKLIVTDSLGCKDSTTKTNYMRVGGPNVNFTANPTGGCMPLNVNFTNQSTPNGGFAITSYSWNFGNGNNSTLTNPSTVYNIIGQYNVSLSATDANGCNASLTKNQYITASKPIVLFNSTTTTQCVGNNIVFTNTSVGNSLTYVWHYGDGGTSTGLTGNHIYTATGTYTVKLVATDIYGCKDSLVKVNFITIKGPSLSFTASDTVEPCPPLAVNFTNTSADAVTFYWKFGNGGQSTVANPSAVYTYPGVYTAKLIGQNADGCMDSVSKNITVYGPTGTLSYNPKAGCNPLTVTFTATTSNTALRVWDMNNGVTTNSVSDTFIYTYTQAGKYVPKLILSDNASCLVPIIGTDTIRVDEVTGDFSYSPASRCDTGTIYFTDTVLYSLTGIVSRDWVFGDGGTSSAHNPSHFYASPGNYVVRLIITNSQGCKDTIQKMVTVHALPNVSAGGNISICHGQTTPVTLQATGATTYTWTPSTGLSCTGCSNPSVLPTTTVTYIVTGTDNNGCKDTGAVTITVNPKPVINVGNNHPVCIGDTAHLNATGAATYLWSPATGLSCANCANPIASPATTTSYKITGTSALGCQDSIVITVTVNQLPIVSAGANDTTCAGDSVQLAATGAVTYSWSPVTGLSCTNCTSPYAKPVASTIYTVTGTDINGCKNTDDVLVHINQLPSVSAGPDKAMCAGFPVSLTVTGAQTYSWSPSTGLSCNNCSSPVANPAISTAYIVSGTDANGCVKKDTINVTVNAIPIITANGKTLMCEGDTSHLLAGGGTTYTWTPATNLSCTNCANPVAAPVVTTTYKVVGTQNGCSDSATITIKVLPKPFISAVSKSICAGGSVTLNAVGGINYTWSPATGLSCTNCPNPIANPATTTTYTLTGDDSSGCENSVQVTVTVHALPDVDAGNDTSICEGTFITLKATGAQDYTWSPNTNISCTNCSNPKVNPENNITYRVKGIDINGCSDSDEISITIIKKGSVAFGNDDTICRGQSVQLFAEGGTEYTWTPTTGLTNPNTEKPIATPDVSTHYKVIIKQGDCYADTGDVFILVNELPAVSLGPDKQISTGTTIKLIAEGDNIKTYEWTPATGLSCADCPAPDASPKQTTTYVVTVTNEFGCESKDDITINVNCDQGLIYIANTFTPNGDGVNDVFFPQGKGVNEIKRLSVYNRWGQLLYEARNIPLNDPALGWDGTYKNEKLKPDVFVYILQAECENGSPIEMKGDVSLIR